MSYRCVIADVAWRYTDQMRDMKRTGNGVAAHYKTTLTEPEAQRFLHDTPLHPPTGPTIQSSDGTDPTFDMMVKGLIPSNASNLAETLAEDCHLWFWVTNAFMEAGYRVVRAWGFEPKTIATWVKGRLEVTKTCPADGPCETVAQPIYHIGQGHYLRNCTEHVIFATRGHAPALVHNLPTAFIYPGRWEGRVHSEKPPIVHKWAELLSPGPRLELFARRRRPGWDAVGDELA